ncbi:MAG: GntR family transcriptional regulator [Candidatus Gallimonas sp.]
MTKKKETLYTAVYNDIISKIKSGELKVGEKLPTEIELTKIYGVSRITVARALKDLAESNLIYRVKKSGTFVNGKLNHSTPLIIPTILPFEEDFNDIMTGIQNTALTYNIFTPFYNTRNNVERERGFLTELLSNNLDGLIVYPCASLYNLDLYAAILTKKIPIVCIDRPIEGLETPLVTSTNADSMCGIVNKLAANGHERIGFFSVSEQMAYTETERFRGFCRGLVQNGLPLKKEYVFNTYDLHKKELSSTPTRQRQLFHKYVKNELLRYLSLEEKPTAICCLNDNTLEMVIKVAKQLGIAIPEELTLTGFDCADIEKAREEGLISVRQDFFRLGSAAVSLMLRICNGQTYPPIELVEGIPVN